MERDARGSKSHHLIDPELVSFVDAFDLPDPCDEKTLQLWRDLASGSADFNIPGVAVETVAVPGARGSPETRLVVVRPDGLGAPAPVFFFIHGGGFIGGSPEAMVLWLAPIVKAADCLAVMPSYRLAPEAQWPTPIEDLYSGLCWFGDHLDEYGGDPNRIAIGGLSAGGGHSAALALYLRKHGGPKIMFQLLHSPMLDDRQPENPYLGEFICTRAFDAFGWGALLGRDPGGTDISPDAVPGRVEDLSGLPATYITVGGLDLFAEACVDFARRLLVAGVPVELHLIPGMVHGGDGSVPAAAVSKRILDDFPRALRTAFSRPANP